MPNPDYIYFINDWLTNRRARVNLFTLSKMVSGIAIYGLHAVKCF